MNKFGRLEMLKKQLGLMVVNDICSHTVSFPEDIFYTNSGYCILRPMYRLGR